MIVRQPVCVNGAELVYGVAGPRNGRPVIFLPSLLARWVMMYPLMEHFAAKGYCTYVIDYRGQGSSAPVHRSQLGLRALTDDIVAFIRTFGLERPHVVGNSEGGMIALRLAAWRPDLVSTVTALGASAEAEYRRPEFDRLADHLTAHGVTGVLDTGQGPRPVLDVLMHIMFGDWTLANNHDLTTRWRKLFAALEPRIGDAASGVINRDSIVDDLHGCQVPVLAIAGREDHVYPDPISGKNIAEAVGANGRYVLIDDAGHSVAMEQPAAVIPHLEQHFASTDNHGHDAVAASRFPWARSRLAPRGRPDGVR